MDGNRNDIAAAAVNEVDDRRMVDRSSYPSAGSYGGSSGRAISMFLRPALSVIAESLAVRQWSREPNAVETAMMTKYLDRIELAPTHPPAHPPAEPQ